MAITEKLLNDQEIGFDNHTRAKQIKDLKGIHFHKKMKKTSKYYANAYIKIYVDGKSTWETFGKNSGKLEKELRNVFDEMRIEDKIIFANKLIVETEKFFTSEYLTKEIKDTIRNNIFHTFFDLDEKIIISKQFQSVFYSYSDLDQSEVIIKGRKYRITFNTKDSKKEIIIKDITSNND